MINWFPKNQIKPAIKRFQEAPKVLLARDNLVDFMEYQGKGRWDREPHLKLLCSKLEDVANGKVTRLMVFMPPRHGKSEVASVRFPAWYFGKHPNRYIMITSYSADLAYDFSRKARETLRDEREVFPDININPTSRAVAHWAIDGHQGGLIAAGVGGPITGRGAHVAIIDDPFKNFEEAQSDTVRESVYQWYKSTFRTRLAPNGAIVLIMTRWHEDDLAGRLLLDAEESGEEWDVIEFPAIAMTDNDQLGRTAGEALSPRFPLGEINKLKGALGPYLFNALYQQRPRPEEGNFFNVNWLIESGSLPGLLNKWKQSHQHYSTYAAMDLAITEKKENAYNAISVGLVTPDAEKILCDVVRFKGDTYDIAQKIIEVQQKWDILLFIFEEGQIRKAIWPVVVKMAKKAKTPINYDFVVPITDKLARARTLQGQMRNGEWLFPHASTWFEDYQEEMLGFPNTKFKDQVDSHAHLARAMADLNILFDPLDLNKCAA